MADGDYGLSARNRTRRYGRRCRSADGGARRGHRARALSRRALPDGRPRERGGPPAGKQEAPAGGQRPAPRSEEHTSELQSLMRISYAVFCLKKKKTTNKVLTQTTRIT